jgi:hypothetical protein
VTTAIRPLNDCTARVYGRLSTAQASLRNTAQAIAAYRRRLAKRRTITLVQARSGQGLLESLEAVCPAVAMKGAARRSLERLLLDHDAGASPCRLECDGHERVSVVGVRLFIDECEGEVVWGLEQSRSASRDYFPEYREAFVIDRVRSDPRLRDELYVRVEPRAVSAADPAARPPSACSAAADPRLYPATLRTGTGVYA